MVEVRITFRFLVVLVRSFANILIILLVLCSGPSFIQFIDELPPLHRKIDASFVMPIIDKYRDMGTFIMGKVEAGEAKKGQSLLLMPNRVSILFVT